MTAPKLQPCPFCGSSSNLNWTRHSYVCCDNCDAFGPSSEYPMSAISEWNTRPDDIDHNAAADAITALRAERDAWKAQCEAVQREAEKCFSAQEEIDAAWDAFGTSGNRKVLSLAEQIASHQREVDEARAAYARGEHDAGDEYLRKASVWRSLDGQ